MVLRQLLRLSLVFALLIACVAGVSRAGRASAPLAHGLDLANIDHTCKPCDDFARFATGRFAALHPIPSDHAAIDTFSILSDRQLERLHDVLEKTAADTALAPGSDAQKLGTFYKACTDVDGREAAGLTPLQPELDRIDAVTDTPSLVTELASLAKIGVNAVYGFGSSPDEKHTQNTIALLSDGDLGLPDRDFYFASDAKSKVIRTKYVVYVAQLLELGGQDAPDRVEGEAADILALETSLAGSAPTRAERRDANATYHILTVDALASSAPEIDWTGFLRELGPTQLTSLDVSFPRYTSAATKQLAVTPVTTWKAYLRFLVLDHFARQLPKRFDDARFAFRGTVLSGQQTQRPQWYRCAAEAGRDLQDIVSVAFARDTFSPEAKARAQALIGNVHAALHGDLRTLAWMTPHTRARAEFKLARMVRKIGYPDKPLDYGALSLSPGPYAQQVLATSQFAWNDDVARIGKPTDRDRWGLPASEVNAYYSPENNEIVFPAAILGPPFFDAANDDAINYGSVGAVMGHETTHGFDDEGRNYDENGNLDDWWTPGDAARFKARSQCIVHQFDAYEAVPGVHENGAVVQGEAIADLGGLTLAYAAFERTPEAKAHRRIDGYTPEQRFFLAFANTWAASERPEARREQALSDPHPDSRVRVIGTLSNMPAFEKAFACSKTAKMVRRDRCQIW